VPPHECIAPDSLHFYSQAWCVACSASATTALGTTQAKRFSKPETP